MSNTAKAGYFPILNYTNISDFKDMKLQDAKYFFFNQYVSL